MNKKYIRIVRYANEQFHLQKFILSEYIYHGVVKYTDPVEIQMDYDPLLSPKFSTIAACYCHFHHFDTNAFSSTGNMAMRMGHDLNIAYMPADQLVYVRAINEQYQSFVRFFRIERNPFTQVMYKFNERSITDKFTWVKMKLGDAVQRNEEYLKHNKIMPEKFSEMLLTADSKNSLRDVIHKDFNYYFHKKYPPTKDIIKRSSIFNRWLFK